MKRINRSLFIALLAVLLFTSCLTPAEVNYLQDMRHGTQIELENVFQARVCPYDELDIIIFSSDEEQEKPFNLSSINSVTRSNTRASGAYLVDVNGNIQFPILGTIHVAGLTRLEMQDTISHLLISNSLLPDAVVVVRFANFKIFFLGAEGGKAITISNERCTFLEALALIGGLDAYTSRNKIAVMREENGKIVTHFLDPRSTDVFYDPYFLLQQNDIIVTQSFRRFYAQNALSTTLNILTMVTSLVSTVALIFVATKD